MYNCDLLSSIYSMQEKAREGELFQVLLISKLTTYVTHQVWLLELLIIQRISVIDADNVQCCSTDTLILLDSSRSCQRATMFCCIDPLYRRPEAKEHNAHSEF
jgi:hypothetical protein